MRNFIQYLKEWGWATLLFWFLGYLTLTGKAVTWLSDMVCQFL